MRTSVKNLLARVEEFVREQARAGDGGGYAKVEPTDVPEIAVILHEMLACKYPKDADGDLPINFKLVDRTVFEPSHFFNIPYTTRAKTPEEYDDPIDLACGNVKMAAERLDVLIHCRQELARQLKEKAKAKS